MCPPSIGLASALAPVWAAVWLSACAPDTDLVAAPGPSGTTAGAAALIDPAPGASGVPLNLAAILVRFQRAVLVPDGSLTITAGGRSAGAGAAASTDCPGEVAGSCFRVPLVELLMPSVTYLVSVQAGVSDLDGQPLPSGPVGQFATSAEADVTPPAITGFAIQVSGACVFAGFQTDELAAGTLWIRGGGVERSVSAGAGVTEFAVAASVASFGGGLDLAIGARAVDLAGNSAETAAVSITVPPGLLPVAITEVQANPAGPEPGQEFVEVRNLGSAPVDLAGLTIEDAKGADVLPASMLGAGAYGLIVPSGFDPASPVDTPPRPGTTLIHVDSRIGADGMGNGGEAIFLRTPEGAVVSSYGGFVDVSSSKWSGKSVHRIAEDACDQAATWTRLPSAATPGWGGPP